MKENMKILLIMPKVDIGYQDWPVPPVGIAYVSASLKKAGYCVSTLNLNLYDKYDEVLRSAIVDNSIDIVGIGGLIVNYHTIKEIVGKCKNVKPEILVWIGGGYHFFGNSGYAGDSQG